MVSELATHTMRAGAPAPSVETILHATIPHVFVDHTHADAALSVSNAPDGEKRIREIYGDAVVANLRRKEFDADRMAAAMVRHMADLSSIEIRGATRDRGDYRPTQPLILPEWITA